jgi:hypothetical protein
MSKNGVMEPEFATAAFQPHRRGELLDQLFSDPALLTKAIVRRDYLAQAHARAQVFDRDHISKVVHDMLDRMVTQVANAKAEQQVKVV